MKNIKIFEEFGEVNEKSRPVNEATGDRIAIGPDEFEKLVNREEVDIDGVKVIFSDIGFANMINYIKKAEQKFK